MTIKEYSQQQGVSYEAIRAQVARYSSELEGLIVKKGRVFHLTQGAIDFLNQKRSEHPVIVHNLDFAKKFEQLQIETQELIKEQLKIQKDLIASQTEIIALLKDKK